MRGELEIFPLLLAELALPAGHPEAGGDGASTAIVQAFAVRDGDEAVLVDTGVGEGVPPIDRAYSPRRRSLEDALGAVGIPIGDVTAVVNSHLHFDHCGGNARFRGVPITVQRAEYEAAHATPYYTVLEWLDAPGLDYRVVDGEARVSARTRVVPTPGHTPGHQSLLVGDDRLIVCQAAYTAAEFEAARCGARACAPGTGDEGAYLASVDRLHALRPQQAWFSHDLETWTLLR